MWKCYYFHTICYNSNMFQSTLIIVRELLNISKVYWTSMKSIYIHTHTHTHIFKKPTIIEKIELNRLHLFGHVQKMKENRIPKRILYMNFGTRSRGRPRNRWQDEVREDGWRVGGEGWQEKVHNREEWKKFLRTARNHHILHMPKEWMNLYIYINFIDVQ